MDTPEPHSFPDLTDDPAQMQPALAALADVARVNASLSSTMRTVAAAVAQMQADSIPTLAERVTTAMTPALSVPTASMADLSGVSIALQRMAETQSLARQPWFTEGVQALYASDVLDRLDEQTLTDPLALPAEEAADLGAVALTLQQDPLLTDAQAKRLFQAWVCVLLFVLWAYVSVSLEDGPLTETLGSAASVAEVVGAATALTALVWNRRSPRSEDGTPDEPAS
ncbi:hypothetical protein [Streptomyces fradiae]|uniref:hypothetical protein n=1 Tax=Streptomyces fradiae TaxID=1906 RepID=UPI0037F32EA4